MATLNVKILSPKQVLFEGQAKAVSSRNSLGNFDVLPGHANFITLLEGQRLTLHLEDGSDKFFDFPLAVLHCTSDQVTVYSEITSDFLAHLS